jgi:diguanylate cyclase (GGDEF)-like protein/PAS domain S-box-containing protein
MATIGEIVRFIGILAESFGQAVGRQYARLAARLLGRDQLVAGSERKFRALLEAAPDAMVIIDWHGHIKLVNAQAEKLFGWSHDEIVGRTISDLIPERFRERHRVHLKGYMRDPSPRLMGAGLDLLALRNDGTEFPVEISLGQLQTDQGLLISSAIRDISERKRSEAALREAEERFRTAFEEAPVGMAVAGLDGQLWRVNRALCEITGRPREELEGSTFESLTHPADRADHRAALDGLLSGARTRFRAERRYLHAGGYPVTVDVSVAIVRDADGEASHLLAQLLDITERKQHEGQLQHLVDHDTLTGMFNRRRFEQELEREHAQAMRSGGTGAVMAVDIDHFKYVNDSLGHSVGDDLIRRVASIFRDRLRRSDIVARLGGDEFAVILPGASRDDALIVAETLLQAIREEKRVELVTGTPMRVTASIGVALFSGSERSGEELLVEADIAMYDAKEAGRDRVEVYDSANGRQGRMQARLAWVDRIRDAIEDNRFVLHGQTILPLGEDPVPRLELLIRMRGDNDELVPPGTFLDVAERFDLIQAIDRWVMSRAIELLATEKQAGRPLTVQVNLSAKSVADASLADWIAGELSNAGIDGSGLCLEVTETAAIVNLDHAQRFARTLGELGCELALDDFGAGFASFYYLKHMVFDYVKIDGEFIRDLPRSSINQLVVRSVVDIARGLGKRTIAEFVEDEPTLQMLRDYSVDYAQGFYIAKPGPLGGHELLSASTRAFEPGPGAKAEASPEGLTAAG